MKKNRKKYPTEFKEEAVKLITEQGYQISEAARNLGVNANMLGRWKLEAEEDGENAPDIQKTVALQAELSRLRKKMPVLRWNVKS